MNNFFAFSLLRSVASYFFVFSLQFSKTLTPELSLLSKALQLLSAKTSHVCSENDPVWSRCARRVVAELRTAFGCLSRAVAALFGGAPPNVVGFVYAKAVSNIRVAAAEQQFQTSWSLQEDLTAGPGKPRTKQQLEQCKQEYIFKTTRCRKISRKAGLH